MKKFLSLFLIFSLMFSMGAAACQTVITETEAKEIVKAIQPEYNEVSMLYTAGLDVNIYLSRKGRSGFTFALTILK